MGAAARFPPTSPKSAARLLRLARQFRQPRYLSNRRYRTPSFVSQALLQEPFHNLALIRLRKVPSLSIRVLRHFILEKVQV